MKNPFRKAKTQETVTSERVQMYLRTRFNPIRSLTPATLSYQLDRFDSGYVRDAALTWDKMEERDDVLKSVAPKRKKAVSRHGWEVVMFEESPEAQAQKDALEQFFGSLTATSAVDGNVKGGMSMLMRQMMDAVGKRYAVHEIVWQPRPEGLTAEFRFVPLWFCENTTGRLRYLQNEGATAGIDLAEGEWMVTSGDGLMQACSVAYMFKHMPLKDWVLYSERHGMPGLHGVTDAAEGSTEWNSLVTALQNFGVDWALVTNRGAEIDTVDAAAAGELPYPKLVERMDRAIAALWRGADLSTMSAGSGEGTGASLQGEEADILEDDDAEMIEETLNRQVVPFVLQYTRGNSHALAELKVTRGNQQDVKLDLEVDRFLLDSGCPVSINDLLERYGRPLPDAAEDLARAAAKPAAPLANVSLANARDNSTAGQLLAAARMQLAEAQQHVLRPVAERLNALYNQADAQDADPEDLANALRAFRDDELPELLAQVNADPETADVLNDLMAAALLNGYAEAAHARKGADDAG